MTDRVLTQAVKFGIVEAAQKLMLKAGCQVTEIREGDRVTIDVYVPPDSQDPHGERFMQAWNAANG